MQILIGLTYYRPYISGITIYAERLARAFARHGHDVTVLTSQFEPQLAHLEYLDGVKVIRIPPMLRISKGLIMPGMPLEAWKIIRQADVINLHLPQLDAAYIAWFGKLLHKPVVLTYHCDLRLPRGLMHGIANQVSHVANNLAAWNCDGIISHTHDYAEHSRFLIRHLDKLRIINPLVDLAPASEMDIRAFREKFGVQKGQRIIGMAARLATEKGVEYLIQALPEVLQRFPETRVLYVGSYKNVVGEEQYEARILPLIKDLKEHWSFLGNLSDAEMTAFFKVCDVLSFPSLNSTEAFGLVQIEAMSCGTPVVATDLPGVRVPVKTSGMGRIVPVADAQAIASAIMDIFAQPERYRGNPSEIMHQYSSDVVATEHEDLFESFLQRTR